MVKSYHNISLNSEAVMIKDFERSFCVILIILLFASTLIISLGFFALSGTSGRESVAVMADADGSLDTLTLDNITVHPYDPVSNAVRQSEIERMVRENGCIVVLSQEDGPRGENRAQSESNLRHHYYNLTLNDDQQDFIFLLCEHYDVPAELVFRIFLADSERYSGESTGHKVMFPNFESAKWYLSEYNISDPDCFEGNMTLAVVMLSEYYHRYPDVHMIAMCYELGEKQALELKSSGVAETEFSSSVALKINTLLPRDHR